MLKKGDKVVMHTCGEAEHYNGKIWTCKTDEYVKGDGIYKQNLVFLEGLSSCFLTKFLQKVDLIQETPKADLGIIHVIALKDNKIYDLQKEKENLERQLKRSEKEWGKTAKNLFNCRKKLKEIKQVVNE